MKKDYLRPSIKVKEIKNEAVLATSNPVLKPGDGVPGTTDQVADPEKQLSKKDLWSFDPEEEE